MSKRKITINKKLKTSKLKFNFKQLGNDITVYPFVEIKWLDIEGDAGWCNTKDLNTIIPTSVIVSIRRIKI